MIECTYNAFRSPLRLSQSNEKTDDDMMTMTLH